MDGHLTGRGVDRFVEDEDQVDGDSHPDGVVSRSRRHEDRRTGISRREVQARRVGDPGVRVAQVVFERAGGDGDVVVGASGQQSGVTGRGAEQVDGRDDGDRRRA